MKIQSLATKDGQRIQLGGFTVLVGPNNVGKSQTLRDVHQKLLADSSFKGTILEELEIEWPTSVEELFRGLEVQEHKDFADRKIVRGITSSLVAGEVQEFYPTQLEQQFAQPDRTYVRRLLGKFRVAYLDASSRLQVAAAADSHNPHAGPPTNLLQGLFVQGKGMEDRLRETFKETFGLDIRLDYSGMRNLALRLAKEFPTIPEDPREAIPIMSQFNQLDVQGDGFRSFVGVVLSLLLSEGRIVLLDEPEAFLHPAQAFSLGNWMAEHSGDSASQVIVATHNANFLAGILSASTDVSIFRLNRNNDETTFTAISSETTSKMARSPLLSSQRVLEAIFHRGVVLCEGDADRAVYQSVAIRELQTREIFFTHAHNKQTIPQVASVLVEASIPVSVIVDIDVLNSRPDFEQLILSLGGTTETTDLIAGRDSIAASIDSREDEEILADATVSLEEFVEQLRRGEHSVDGVKGAMNRLRASLSTWATVKRGGVNALPEDTRQQATRVLEEAKGVGIFVVPVGELENWISLQISQKGKWVVRALEEIDAGNCPPGLKTFVQEVVDSLTF